MDKKKVLFICTHNSARSQMAEGIVNHYWGDRLRAFSAGTKPSKVHQSAITVTEEIGIDLSHHRSKSIDEFKNERFDIVVTVCDHAKETCPFFPQALRTIHKGFEDPARAEGTQEEILSTFREVRDRIKEWIEIELIKMIEDEEKDVRVHTLEL
jgi:arsenate reductase